MMMKGIALPGAVFVAQLAGYALQPWRVQVDPSEKLPRWSRPSRHLFAHLSKQILAHGDPQSPSRTFIVEAISRSRAVSWVLQVNGHDQECIARDVHEVNSSARNRLTAQPIVQSFSDPFPHALHVAAAVCVAPAVRNCNYLKAWTVAPS